MAIVQETFEVNGRQFVRTWSNANRYVVGGMPEDSYEEAIDPAELGRTYVEGAPIDTGIDPEEAQISDYEQELADLGVRFE